MPIKKKKISELNEAGDLKGFYTIGYRLLGGVKESVKIGLEYIQTAYEKVVQATKDAIAATTDMRQLEATVEENEEARETAESRRTASEQSRQTAESERLEKENERNVSEELRVSAETQRGAAEEERRTAEGDRKAAEQIRDAAEQNRKVEEAGRVTAEQARATEYAGIKTESEDVIATHRSAVASANQAAIYANREGDTAKEKASLADAAAQAANTAATTIDDKMQTAINKLIAGAPDALDTLNELAAALGNDPNFATTIAAELGKKLNKTDIINDVVTGGVDKVLSAQQGVELAGQIVEMGKNAGGKMVLIPSAVLNLTNTSTSNEILDAFGGKEAFIDIVKKVKEGAPAAINANGTSIILSACNGTVAESNNQYILNFILINPIDTAANFIMAITLTGDIATIDKQFYSYGYANIVNIPLEITSLTSDSTNDQIITAFNGKEAFNTFIKKVKEGNAVVVMSGVVESIAQTTGCFVAITKYINDNNLELEMLYFVPGIWFNLSITVSDGIFSCSLHIKESLTSSQLISDPSTGGTDRPASAEAVKVVNDKVATIQGRIEDGSLKGEKGDKGDTGPQGPQGPAGSSDWNSIPNMIQGGNEVNFCDNGYNNTLWINYTSRGRGGCNISTVIFGNGTSGGRANVEANRFAAPAGFWKESDRRLKCHITPLRHTLDQILAIPTAGFVMDGKQQIGTIAQEVEKICPEVVSESFELKSQVPERNDWEVFVENDHKGNPQEYVKVKRVEYEMLGVLALEGVKLLKAEIDELKDELKRLKDGRD